MTRQLTISGMQLDPGVAAFGQRLWLAATANHEARSVPDSAVQIPVPNEAIARELAGWVVDYAHKAFRCHVETEYDRLVWPNGSTLEFLIPLPPEQQPEIAEHPEPLTIDGEVEPIQRLELLS